MSYFEKFKSLSKDAAIAELFTVLNSKAIDVISESKALSLIKAAQMLGYKHHQDIPETSDDAIKLEKLSQEILDKESAKEQGDKK